MSSPKRALEPAATTTMPRWDMITQATFLPVVSYAQLAERAASGSGWVVIDPKGRVMDVSVPSQGGPATLLVAPVTDALKELSAGRVVGSLDRDQFWEVAAFALSHDTLTRLEGDYTSATDLYQAVVAAGLDWQVRPMPPSG